MAWLNQSSLDTTRRVQFILLPLFRAQVVKWQTRMIQVHVPRGMGVQVPP